jgi:hypothetical protein
MPTRTLNFPGAGLLAARWWCWSPRRNETAALQVAAAPAPTGREVSARRAEAMRGFFPKLASWIDHHGFAAEMSEVDRYLSQAADLPDLERRIRDIERRSGTPRWFQ